MGCHFQFNDDDINKWIDEKKKGECRKIYPMHCWLSLNDAPIDLTLAETLYDNKENHGGDRLIPENITYIGPEEAENLGIKYHRVRYADEALFKKIGMLPG